MAIQPQLSTDTIAHQLTSGSMNLALHYSGAKLLVLNSSFQAFVPLSPVGLKIQVGCSLGGLST